MNRTPRLVCYGEILWDVYPDKKVIGGAPLNVALRLHSQGHHAAIISKIGIDPEGKKAIEYLKEQGFPTKGIQRDDRLKTGEVLVSVNAGGTASYIITEPVAWDRIVADDETVAMVRNSEVFIFGSLVCRRPKSKETLYGLLKESRFSVFDVNLRPPFYTLDVLVDLMKQSQFVKMNDEELLEIVKDLNGPHASLKEMAFWLKEAMGIEGLCVTKGAHGADLLLGENYFSHSGFKVKVEDTVGAGDSFLATLIGGLFINKEFPNSVLEKACAVGALVASKAGANCKIAENEVRMLIN